MSLKFEIDIESLTKEFKALKMEAEAEVQAAVARLASSTHAYVVQKVEEKLKSGRKHYLDNLGFEEVSPGIWVVSVDGPALAIEEGGESWDMKPGLLKNAKMSADGKRYKVVPFDHNTPPSQRTANASKIVGELKEGLKKINQDRKSQGLEKISTHKIEKDSNGSPRIGLLHKFDLPSDKPSKNAQHPALKGLSVYQSLTGNGKVRRDVMTFRTVTENSPSDSWLYPQKSGVKLLDEAAEWCENQWNNEIVPNLFSKLRD